MVYDMRRRPHCEFTNVYMCPLLLLDQVCQAPCGAVVDVVCDGSCKAEKCQAEGSTMCKERKAECVGDPKVNSEKHLT